MKTFIINSFIHKKQYIKRKNFELITDKTSEEDIKKLISEKLTIDETWLVEKDTYELKESESVVIYNLYLKPSGIEPQKQKKEK
jgi:hypothetical protein